MQSANAMFKFNIQPDGNLVVYQQPDSTPMWSSGTPGNDATGGRFGVQMDGNMVYRFADGTVIWHATTHTYSTPGKLVLQDDGDLVLSRISDNHVMWSSLRGGKL